MMSKIENWRKSGLSGFIGGDSIDINRLDETYDTEYNTWDYLGFDHSVMGRGLFNQNDWNQTLASKIITTSNILHDHADFVIMVDNKLKPLFNSLDGYNAETSKLSGKYDVFFGDDLNNWIMTVTDATNNINFISILNYTKNE